MTLCIHWSDDGDAEFGWRDIPALADEIETTGRDWYACVEIDESGAHPRAIDRGDELRAEIQRLRDMEPYAADDPEHIRGVRAFTGHAA